MLQAKTKKLYCCDFDKTLEFNDQQPEGFQEWATQIVYNDIKCTYSLPDSITGDIKIFVNNQGVFDRGAFTSFILKVYKSQNNI